MSDLLASAAQVIFLIGALPIVFSKNRGTSSLLALAFTVGYVLLAVSLPGMAGVVACIGVIMWAFISIARSSWV